MQQRSIFDGIAARWAAVLVSAGFAAASVAAADSPVDFTGVWASADGAAGSRGRSVVPPAPLRPEARRRHEAFNEIVGPTGDTPGGVCLGAGMPAAMLGAGSYPMEIIQRPGQVTIVYELHGETRRIYLGDRNLPEQDRVPGRSGYSSGLWEDEALVVTTDNLVEQLDQRETPHSAEARIVERYRLQGTDAQGRRLLVAQVTLVDPAFYTAPLQFERRWHEVPNGHLMPYDCNEEVWLRRVEALARGKGLPLP